jgi:hypothetical protein
MGRKGLSRRRAVAAIFVATLCVVAVVALAGTADASAPPGRYRIHLIKLCPPKATNPNFEVINWTGHPDPFDKQLGPTTITFWITQGNKLDAPAIPFVVKGEAGSPVHDTYAS